MWWLIILLILVSVLLYFLLTPIVLVVDSRAGVYKVTCFNLVSVALYTEDWSPKIRLRVAFWEKIIDPFANITTKKKEPSLKAKQVKGRSRIPFRLIRGILFSFRVKKFHMAIDTGNYALNGMLYPFCAVKHVNINFVGNNELFLVVHNTAARILWAVIKSKFLNLKKQIS
jgi:hypothetical protein